LADNGRTVEAVSLLQRTQADAGLQEEAGMRAELRMQLAKLALQRGDEEGAAVWIGQALDGMALKDYDERDYAQACYLHAVLLQRTGRVAELKAAVAALKAWVAGRPKPDDWVTIWLLRAQAVQAWGEGQHEQAIEQLKTAMAAADAKGVPEGIVAVGQSYALALLAAGHAEQAAAISGRLSSWSKLDWRAAQVEARVYQALGQAQAAQAAWIKARQLAGDRPWQAGPATVF
jgi:predicted Zn-dependent protease